MENLDPAISFAPDLVKAFPDDRILVAKTGWGGRSITAWYDVDGTEGPRTDWAYEEMLSVARTAAGGSFDALASVVFVWMQGTRDGRDRGDDYEANLAGLISRLERDLGRPDLLFVIGRIPGDAPDPGWQPRGWEDAVSDWEQVRRAQQSVAEREPRGAWVDTDDLERTGKHFTESGYRELGHRFAAAAIERIRAAESGGSPDSAPRGRDR